MVLLGHNLVLKEFVSMVFLTAEIERVEVEDNVMSPTQPGLMYMAITNLPMS